MSEIIRVPESVSGVKDGVSLEANCVYTKFENDKMKQQMLPCKLLASWENGVVSLSFEADGLRRMVGVRLDEMLALLGEASTARNEAQKGTTIEQKDS